MTTEGTWVIRRTNDWTYFSQAGGKVHYVRDIKKARRFKTLAEAEQVVIPFIERAVRIEVG